MMNFTRFKLFMDAFQQFEDVSKALELGIPDLSGYIWGPTCYILNLRQQPETRICLAWMYSDLLQFNASIIKLFQIRSKSTMLPSWRKTFAASWKDYDGPFQTLLRAFDSHGSFLKRSLDNQQHQSVQGTHQVLNDHILQYQWDRNYARRQAEEAEVARKHKQCLDVIHWLHSPGMEEPEIQYQNEFLKIRSEYPDTGKWILREDKVQDWIEADIPDHSLLWIHGKKGAERTESTISYFYCREKDEGLGEPRFLAIMKSLLRQLVSQNEDLLPTLHDKRMRGQEILNDESTAKTLLELFCEVDMSQFIVIDGLDEISDVHKGSVVQLFDSIVEKSNEHHPGKIRILILSTELPLIRKRMESNDRIGEFALNPSSTLKDIESYVAKQAEKLEEEFSLGSHNLKLIESLICRNSDGMFLYAFLVIENLLEQPNARYVLMELQESNFPKTLGQAYSRIIERLRSTHHENTWKESKKIFGWLAHAKRPLQWHELQAALSISIDEQGYVRPQDHMTTLRKDIRVMCGSLVHVIGGNSIDFVHQTAKEFVQLKIWTEDRERYARKGYYAFQDYAMSKWDSHLNAMIGKSSNLFQGQDDGQEIGLKVSNVLRVFCCAYEKSWELVNAGQENNAREAAIEATKHCEPFQHRAFHAHLLKIWTHAVKHHKQPFKERNKISINELGEALKKSRETLEGLAEGLDDDDELAKSLRKFYGSNFYKCTGITCPCFYEGVASKEDLEKHLNRHDRPFPCTTPNCSLVPFGFPTNKDRDKHERTYHPETSDQPSEFVVLGSRATAAAKYECRLCQRSYTRQANLTAHLDGAHFGRRPFACGTCGREFTRRSDRTRHERIHVRMARVSS
ncbi:hypothetical protein BGZ61DRAFT_402202 [Ilyonectria robusta]|uniref:uncharacterized protein n=1 Tax=Ilyonectria robusta TaxID=1079257 RepID=UPI001E8DE909|nr:uncharacterized protein BGZ61DRAFT_402202 [Ilyonectria robusta]KAH8663256.1 hypothetical protein BGZ61DRAFT_402202 [Ilyonectria robusta]